MMRGRFSKFIHPYQNIYKSWICKYSTPSFENTEELISKMNSAERQRLMTILKTLESEDNKAEFRGQLAAYRWRSKLGRPSKISENETGDVDATGSYCPLPDDWFMKKCEENEESTPKPTHQQLFQVGLYNAVPFIGFGFLDNSIMIICGDSIEITVGSLITLSTMAAAALGNTFSDILGISSAFYVEKLASKLGVRQPPLTPIQVNMSSSRFVANLGRTIGVTIGCLLGMFPLLFKSDDKLDDSSNGPKTED